LKPENRIALVQAAPLPVRNGVAPSRVFLPSGSWATLGQFLQQRFPHVPPHVLQQRLLRGDIVDQTGTVQHADQPYQSGRWLWYYREVPDETRVPFDVPILYRDDHLVVVDKPHFLASTPGGRYLRETALSRLRQQLDLPDLTPLHRLDRDTAGVLMFCAHPPSRGAYQALFQSREVFKEYLAVARPTSPWRGPVSYRSRLEQRSGHFTMQEAAGLPNSQTRIELLRTDGALALFRLVPATGRKHQLRVHMAALGMPILNDMFYPELKVMPAADDFSSPLQLLALRVCFRDPISGREHCFGSRRRLMLHYEPRV
jgi:tRNA pseudouridine32 synthase/23S rRNA pseudouridine746 synthase